MKTYSQADVDVKIIITPIKESSTKEGDPEGGRPAAVEAVGTGSTKVVRAPEIAELLGVSAVGQIRVLDDEHVLVILDGAVESTKSDGNRRTGSPQDLGAHPELTTPDGRRCRPVFLEDGEAIYLVAAVAAAASLSVDRVSDLIKEGRVRASKPGTDWLVSLNDVLHHVATAKPGRPKKSSKPH